MVQGLSTSGPQSSGVGCFCPSRSLLPSSQCGTLHSRSSSVEDACFIFIPSFDGFTRFTLMFLPGIPQEWGPEFIFTWEVVPHTDAKRHGLLLS